MQKLWISLIALLAFGVLNAQERIPVELQSDQLTLSILEPAIAYELKLSQNQSLVFRGGLTVLYEDIIDNNDDPSLHPFVSGSFRNYYARKRVKKELKPNSGNYIALVGGYIFDNITNEEFVKEQANSWFVGPVWGIQRNYKSGIHLGLSLGGGFGSGDNMNFDFVGIGGFSLGFVLK